MLKLSLAIFTVVALIGLMLARNVFAKRASSRAARTLHVLPFAPHQRRASSE